MIPSRWRCFSHTPHPPRCDIQPSPAYYTERNMNPSSISAERIIPDHSAIKLSTVKALFAIFCRQVLSLQYSTGIRRTHPDAISSKIIDLEA
jgi:hypothetical protein